ncbi:MAG: sugar phosphate isomerase/epimerase family protein [SAR324 cluster bacterium]|nr:sugar phosphate isomerase/epimerase family protein [SAR324 cluster bacterium]
MENLTLEELCVHQVCIWEKSSFRESLECMARNGVSKTAIWKPLLVETELKSAKQNLIDSGVKAISMCPLVLLDEDAYPDPNGRLSAHRQFLEIAAELGVESVVVITGGLPSGSRDLKGQRLRVQEELSLLIPLAKAVGVRLALEPLHPMVCGHRSVISTLSEANEILDSLDANETLGIAVDSYALWWDSSLEEQIERSGKRLFNFHVSDWLHETRDVRLDRGMPGDGIIDNRMIRSWMAKAGFQGSVEVEILSEFNWWKQDPEFVLQSIVKSLPNL